MNLPKTPGPRTTPKKITPGPLTAFGETNDATTPHNNVRSTIKDTDYTT